MRHRFHSICPYFAMFPEQFAETWIDRCTRRGQTILDPFSGRGTAPFQAILMGRNALGCDVNPVAYVLTGAKVDSPQRSSVKRRLRELEESFEGQSVEEERKAMPTFFHRAFHHATLRQLLFLRSALGWEESRVDRFIAALALGSLHGEMSTSRSYFSNQMPRTISTKPAYSLRFWKRYNLWPRKRDVFALLRQRLDYRFESTRPSLRGEALLGDVRDLPMRAPQYHGRVDAVITSPPYLDVTNFEEDQWLRLWLLGGEPRPGTGRYSRDDRYEQPDLYWSFLCDAWRATRPLLKKRSRLICRIGGRNLSVKVISEALKASMQFLGRRWHLSHMSVSHFQRRQTEVFRPGSIGCRFEVDYCFDISQ